jgi:hypothetical protein
MGYNFAGFKDFMELQTTVRTYGHGKNGAMDSLDTTAFELGIPQKALGSTPDAFANVQIGDRIMSGPSSFIVQKIGNNTVTLVSQDDGIKRMLNKPGGKYVLDTPRNPRTITIPRAYYVKMRDDQYGGASGAMAGPVGGGGGGLPPMI